MHLKFSIFSLLAAMLLGPTLLIAQERFPGIEELMTEEEREASGVNEDRKSTRLNSSHITISYAVFCLKKKKQHTSLT